MAKKIAVVGAGPGGLTAAMILARRGFDVTVLEAQPEVGGRNAGFSLGGYRFDTGPTFLMLDFILREMFAEAGCRAEDYLQFSRVDPLYRLVFDDRELRLSPDRAKTRAAIAAAFPGEEKGFDAFIKKETERFKYVFPCIQRGYSTLSSMLSPVLLAALPHLSLGTTVFGNLGRYFAPDKLKLSFTFQAKYLGMSPWKCPALYTMLPLVEHKYGVLHVRGGLNAISSAMARAAEANGARIRLSAPVARVLTRGRRAVGVALESGEQIAADEVILNADFGHAMSSLFEPGFLKKYAPPKLDRMGVSCSTFMLYLGVNRSYADLPHHNIVFPSDYRLAVEDIFDRKKMPADPALYIQNASVTDPTLAPAGKSAIYMLAPAPNLEGKTDWEAEKPRLREQLLLLAETRGGFTGLRSAIEYERIITPADWRSQYRVYKGATFNLSHHLSQMLYLRPRNRFEEAGNCWLVGGGTHPGSGLPTIYESARITSNLLCDSLGVAYATPTSLREKEAVLAD